MTTTGELLQRLDWTPPGPGSWTLDKTHVPRPATAHLQRVVPAFSEGFEASAAAYGWLIGKFNITAVNGFVYSNVQIVDLDEMPERFQRCEQAFATKRWRAEVERWDSVVKPAALAAHRDLLAVDLEALDDADLSAYLHRCHDHHAEMWRQHHRFNGTHMVPVGDFVVGASEWTGLPPVEIAGLLRGSSPISRGWCPETEALVEAIRAVPEASDILT
jgi:rifampicin phosphotransferase